MEVTQADRHRLQSAGWLWPSAGVEAQKPRDQRVSGNVRGTVHPHPSEPPDLREREVDKQLRPRLRVGRSDRAPRGAPPSVPGHQSPDQTSDDVSLWSGKSSLHLPTRSDHSLTHSLAQPQQALSVVWALRTV